MKDLTSAMIFDLALMTYANNNDPAANQKPATVRTDQSQTSSMGVCWLVAITARLHWRPSKGAAV